MGHDEPSLWATVSWSEFFNQTPTSFTDYSRDCVLPVSRLLLFLRPGSTSRDAPTPAGEFVASTKRQSDLINVGLQPGSVVRHKSCILRCTMLNVLHLWTLQAVSDFGLYRYHHVVDVLLKWLVAGLAECGCGLMVGGRVIVFVRMFQCTEPNALCN